MTKNTEVQKNIDPLDALLAAEPVTELGVPIKRFGADFSIRVLSEDEMTEIREASKDGSGKSNTGIFNHMMIARACVSPDFKNPDLLKKHGVASAHQCIKKALLAGEVATLIQAIMGHNGFDMDGIEKTKN